MKDRVIKESIKHSSTIDSLTWFQEVLFYRLLVTVDSDGEYLANPQVLKNELFPTKENVTRKSVSDALEKLENVGLIGRATRDGEERIYFTPSAYKVVNF